MKIALALAVLLGITASGAEANLSRSGGRDAKRTAAQSPYDVPVGATLKLKTETVGRFHGSPVYAPTFIGPKTVQAGTKLRIVNKLTHFKDLNVGHDHTFTLVQTPVRRKQLRSCAIAIYYPEKRSEPLLPLCTAAMKDLQAKFTDGSRRRKTVVKNPIFDTGAVGWDATFGPDGDGDSWYTRSKGQSEERVVVAEPGTKLRFMDLGAGRTLFAQGSIKVIE